MSVDESKYASDAMDGDAARPPSNWFKFGKIGDVIKGYLLSVREQENTMKPGEMQKVYELEVIAGMYHNIVAKVPQAEALELKAGDIFQVSGKAIIDKAMRNAEVGQIVIMRYTGDFDVGGGNSAKTVEVKLGSKRPDPNAEIPFK